MVNGVNGETCTDWKTNDTELWCTNLQIPDCVDRRIYCTDPPRPERATISVVVKPNSFNDREYKTEIQYSCPEHMHFFDYPVGDSFVSYYYTTNIRSINVTCNQDG